MRTFFLLLVLANLAFFAWANFIAETDTQSDPRPLARQVSPEKLRIVPASALAKPVSTPGASTAGTAAAAPAPGVACMEWGALTAGDTARASEALVPLGLGAHLSQRQIDDTAAWWVFIAPRASRQDAQKKAGELKALGVDEYFIVQDEGPQHYALSLGVFKTEAAANARLEALRERGVRTAQVGKRDSQLQKSYFQVRPADEALASKLREIAQSFPGTEVRECAPPAAVAAGAG